MRGSKARAQLQKLISDEDNVIVAHNIVEDLDGHLSTPDDDKVDPIYPVDAYLRFVLSGPPDKLAWKSPPPLLCPGVSA